MVIWISIIVIWISVMGSRRISVIMIGMGVEMFKRVEVFGVIGLE